MPFTRMKYPQQRFAARKKLQSQLAGAHARLGVRVLGTITGAMGEHRRDRDPATPDSLPPEIKLWSSLTGWPNQQAAEARVGRERRLVLLLLP